MKIISFAWTTPALLAGRKTVTRREWAHSHAKGFQNAQLVQAYDKAPFLGGKRVAIIRLTQAPRLEPISEAPDSDHEVRPIGGRGARADSSESKSLLGYESLWEAMQAPHPR